MRYMEPWDALDVLRVAASVHGAHPPPRVYALLAILSLAQEQERDYAKVSAIAADLGCSAATVWRALADLRRLGVSVTWRA